jgi:hypothetical protein
MMTRSAPSTFLEASLRDPSPLVHRVLLGSRPVVEFPLGLGATEDKVPHLGLCWRFGLTFFVLSSLAGFGVRFALVCVVIIIVIPSQLLALLIKS